MRLRVEELNSGTCKFPVDCHPGFFWDAVTGKDFTFSIKLALLICHSNVNVVMPETSSKKDRILNLNLKFIFYNVTNRSWTKNYNKKVTRKI